MLGYGIKEEDVIDNEPMSDFCLSKKERIGKVRNPLGHLGSPVD